MNLSDTLVVTAIGVFGTLFVMWVRHFIYETEKIKIEFSGQLEHHPDCSANGENSHDYMIKYNLCIYNLGKSTVHITRLWGDGINSERRKVKFDIQYAGLDEFLGKEPDKNPESLVSYINSTEEELELKLGDINYSLEPDAFPFKFEWSESFSGIENVPNRAVINITTIRQPKGESKHIQIDKRDLKTYRRTAEQPV